MPENNAHTLALTLAYDGAPFSGFARQPGQSTVQGNLEQALRLLFKREIETVCAGRTDAGVHARGQVVSFEVTSNELEARASTLKRSLNALVDDRIAIADIRVEPPGFSARFDAKAREYRYYLSSSAERPVLLDGRVWHIGRVLDADAMREASRFLIGEHDFKSFCTACSAAGKPTRREIKEISLFTEDLLGENVLVVKVIGNAFLHSMVRTLVGTLALVGTGRKQPHWVEQVLEACDRTAAGENAPAHGLYFWNVYY